MADFMVGMNTYYNGMNQGYERTYMPGKPVQAGKGAEEIAKSPKTEKTRKEEEPKDGFRKKEPGEECETCKNRKYKDGSDENVSFKAAAHISPEAAASQVRAHEGEHVANAYSKAAEKGGEVLSVSVRIETSVCPECGKSYVSGGTTSTKIRYPADSEKAKEKNPQADKEDTGRTVPAAESQGTAQRAQNNPYAANQRQAQSNPYTASQRQARSNPYAANQRQLRANAVRGNGFDYATRPFEEFEMERY